MYLYYLVQPPLSPDVVVTTCENSKIVNTSVVILVVIKKFGRKMSPQYHTIRVLQGCMCAQFTKTYASSVPGTGRCICV